VADTVVQHRVGVLGATSLVGTCLLPLLAEAYCQVTAYSRQAVGQAGNDVDWQRLPQMCFPPFPHDERGVQHWICVAPLWVLPEYFALLNAQGARRVVVLSSTSRFTKDNSTDPNEQAIALRLADAEAHVREWAESSGVEWVILRPTLIYGLGRDKNIAEIARFIRRFGFFPLFGRANGLRQPIHAEDVASACLAALRTPRATNRVYNISGGETLTYRDMIARISTALGYRPHLLSVPLWIFSLTLSVLRCLPRYRQWSAAMAERMNQDLVFDHTEATRNFGFRPRQFMLSAADLQT
jgi:nucleoside-diphosphate-sugar epimerase